MGGSKKRWSFKDASVWSFKDLEVRGPKRQHQCGGDVALIPYRGQKRKGQGSVSGFSVKPSCPSNIRSATRSDNRADKKRIDSPMKIRLFRRTGSRRVRLKEKVWMDLGVLSRLLSSVRKGIRRGTDRQFTIGACSKNITAPVRSSQHGPNRNAVVS